MEKILISACFLGEKVRYDGKENTLTDSIIMQWNNEGRFISICPEVVGGLSIPRNPSEIQPLEGSEDKAIKEKFIQNLSLPVRNKQVITMQNQDVTAAFYQGANIALKLCQKYKIRFALLKESSPSCGSTKIYDGSFTKRKINGEGITTVLLREHGIEVFSEKNITGLAAKISEC
jgi:uncharacterized protein YbbK (DUF523 family)